RRLQTGANGIICVTLGKRGVLAFVEGEASMIAGRAVKAVDTTGAGDCLVGALAAQLANGKAIRDALEYANVAASICVQRMGAARTKTSCPATSWRVAIMLDRWR